MTFLKSYDACQKQNTLSKIASIRKVFTPSRGSFMSPSLLFSLGHPLSLPLSFSYRQNHHKPQTTPDNSRHDIKINIFYPILDSD